MSDEAREPVLERALAELRAREPAWDPLRERRAFARIEAALDDRATATTDGAAAPGRRRAVLAGVAAIAAALWLVLWLRPWSTTASEQDAAPVLRVDASPEPVVLPIATPSIPTVTAPTLALADGSIATLHDGAQVQVAVQSAAEIRVQQSSGRVHYEVRPGLPRTFVVAADGVEVTVVGTAFWVTREAAAVRVTVEHGHVRVARGDSDGVADLHAGDELRLELGEDPTPAAAIEPPSVGRTERARRVGKPATTPPATTPASPAMVAPIADVDTLLAAADDALGRGDRAAAAAALDTLVREHGDDPRAYGAAFQLGKIERARGRHRAAAAAFLAATRKSPAGALSEDARAEAALELFEAGDLERARAAAADYLAHHPGGVHVARIEAMRAELP